MPDPIKTTLKTAKLQSTNFQKRLVHAKVNMNLVSVINQAVNVLNSFPSGDKVVAHNNKKYGLPMFRIKKRGGGQGIPESDAFWFTKEEQGTKLHIILEAYRKEKDVYPLNFAGVSIQLNFQRAGEKKSLPLQVDQTPLVNKVNIVKELQASAIVPAEDISAIVESLSSSTGLECTLSGNSKIKWQKPKQEQMKQEQMAEQEAVKEVEGTSWTGTWKSSNGTLRLAQKGNRLFGDYTKVNGTIQGKVRNNLARGTFTNKNKKGDFKWKMNGDKFEGKWKWKSSSKWGDWNGHRTSKKTPTLTSAIKSKLAKARFTLFKPQLMNTTLAKATQVATKAKGMKAASNSRAKERMRDAIEQMTDAKYKKTEKIKTVEHNFSINVSFEKKNPHVFGEILDLKDEFKWHDHSPVGTKYLIYYRPTSHADQFCFLPQVFRIKANMEKGEPRISIAMHTDDKDDWTKYRIALTIQIAPYFHPNAKKDLYNYLAEQSDNTIIYPDLYLSGYKSARFILDPAYSGENQTLRGKMNEEVDSINPSTGFNLSVECNLESFDFLKRELIDGITIGHIVFELEQQTSEGDQIIESEKIPVELNLQKLTNIELDSIVIEGEDEFREVLNNLKRKGSSTLSTANGDQRNTENLFGEVLNFLKEQRARQTASENDGELPQAPYGCVISNKLSQEVEVEGLALTLLSKIGDVIYDADLDLEVENDLPVSLPPGDVKGFSIDKKEIDTLEENYFWTHLAIEPYAIRFNKDPEAFINRLIDYASGDPEEWNLEIDCAVFSNWDLLSEENKVQYRQITDVGVQIKKPSGQIEDVLLSKDEPMVNVLMSRTLAEILNTQSIKERMYQIRQKNYYLTREGEWSEWENIGETEINFKKIYPIVE